MVIVVIDALFGQMLLTSDDIGKYDKEKKALLARALHLYQNAEKKRYVRLGDYLVIYYTLDGQENKLVYDTKKGVFENGR